MPLFPVVPDRETEPFLEGARRSELLIVQDAATGQYFEPSHDVRSPEQRYVPAAGTGTLVSWSVNHVRNPDGTVTRHPFGIVQLTEGPWLWAELLLAPGENEPQMGAAAEVRFLASGPETHHAILPAFSISAQSR